MFLLFFLVFTLIFTIFENIAIAGISLLLVCIILVSYQFISKKKILGKRLFGLLVLGFSLAGIVFAIKEWRYYGNMQEGQKTIIGTGIVSDVSSQGKYIFTYGNIEYLLYSKKEYAIGDQIRVVGRMDSGRIPAAKLDAGMTSRNDVRGKYRTITSGTFAISLFSGSFDFAKRMKMKGRKGTIYEDNSIKLKAGSSNLEAVGIIKQMKKGLQKKIIQIYGKNKVSGLILGMLIGDRSQIPETEYQDFINSGLVHLVAVSGGNILMIVVFLQFFLFFLPFYARLGLILFTIIGYSLICGLDSSVFRAVLMGGMSMVALFRGREINIRRLLSISCIIMLMINPYFLVYDTGFLLSYSALIGIIYFQNNDKGEMINDKGKQNRVKKSLQYVYKSYISPSIGASLGIFPIIIFFMGKINLLGVVGNLFVLPIVPFVMIYGFASVRLYSLLGWQRLLWIETILVQYIYKVSGFLSQYGVYFMVSGLRFKYVVLISCGVMFLLWRFKSPFVSPFIKGDKNKQVNRKNGQKIKID